MALGGFTRRFRKAEGLRGGPLRAALRALLSEDYAGTEEALTGLVREDSRDVDAYLGLAKLYQRRGEVGRAIQVHQNLLLRADLGHDARIDALAGLASDFRHGGFIQRAVAAYQEVLAHDSRHREALSGLLEMLVASGDLDEALAVQRRLARLDRHSDPAGEAVLLRQMAEAAQVAGDGDAARKHLKRSLRKRPGDPDALLLLGELEAERGRNKAALAAWKEVASAGGPAAAHVYPKLAPAFAALGRPTECEAFLREVIAKREDDGDARLALANALSSRGDTEAALSELQSLLDANPAHLAARIALGRLLVAESRSAEATKHYAELLEVLDVMEKSRALTPPETFE